MRPEFFKVVALPEGFDEAMLVEQAVEVASTGEHDAKHTP